MGKKTDKGEEAVLLLLCPQIGAPRVCRKVCNPGQSTNALALWLRTGEPKGRETSGAVAIIEWQSELIRDASSDALATPRTALTELSIRGLMLSANAIAGDGSRRAFEVRPGPAAVQMAGRPLSRAEPVLGADCEANSALAKPRCLHHTGTGTGTGTGAGAGAGAGS
ncbi:hypothetical protein DOTSEDRAFT_24363 [Dothistroma septosporum NZE10]|uniref:Uncharacterized protein n=1 Tax=Dothistroma septosporum (strain NZE10 / CBS 128990) TaxID=675120 RepID=N1PLS2_DOTSN|nr:hypothetical protein DOTSEDRAFT_24363 [Dothistroma septosporum NZE10]